MSKTPLTPRIVKSGAVTIHLDLKRVFIGDQEIHVSGSEWRVLYGLARDADRWRSTDEMVCDLYPGVKKATISASERNAVRMTLTRLRKRIGVDLIHSRPTMGYRILSDQPQPGTRLGSGVMSDWQPEALTVSMASGLVTVAYWPRQIEIENRFLAFADPQMVQQREGGTITFSVANGCAVYRVIEEDILRDRLLAVRESCRVSQP